MNSELGLRIFEDRASLQTMACLLATDGWVLFHLPADISGTADFFEAVRAVLPLDPPVSTSSNWDALSDSLCSGLYSSGNPRVAIVWPGIVCMERNDPAGYQMALAVLRDISETLADPSYTGHRPVQLIVASSAL